MDTQDEIRAKDILPHKTAFSEGDGFYGDGDTSFFMEADKLLELTAQIALADNVAPEFVPNETEAKAGLPYAYGGKLYEAKEDYIGEWNASKFYAVPVSEILDKYAKKQYVKNPRLLTTENGYYYNSAFVKVLVAGQSIRKYDVVGFTQIHIEARIGSSEYSVFRDSSGNVVDNFAGNDDSGLNFFEDIEVPLNAVSLEISSSDTYTTEVKSEDSVEFQVENAVSFIEERAKKDLTQNPLILSSEDGYRYDSSLDKVSTENFAIKKYDVDGYEKLKILARIGSVAYCVFRDSLGNVLSSFSGDNDFYEYSFIKEINVPQGAATLELSVSTLFTTQVFVKSIEQSTDKLSASCNNVAEPLNLGKVAGYYTTSTMSYSSNSSFDVDVYNVEGFDSIYVECRIGASTYLHFVDKNKNILASYSGNSNAGVNFKQTISVPSGSVYFVMSHSNLYEYFVCKSNTFLSRMHIAEKLHLTPLSGKKIGLLGDSIAAGAEATGTLDKFIEVCAIDLNASVHNVAVGGAAYANTAPSQVVSQVANLTGDEDLIVIFASTNDFGRSSPIGEIYTTDADTGHRTPTSGDTAFCPAINKTIQALYTKFGGYVPIVLCTPIQRVLHGGSSSGGSWDKNSIGLYMEDYVKALKEEADFWGIPIFDAYKLNMNPNIETANTAYFADGLHPNNSGHAIIGHSLARFLSAQWFDV